MTEEQAEAVAAALGGEIEVPSIDGGRSRVRVPEGSQSGRQMRLRSKPNIRFAGQITGVEGYVESAAMGLLAGRMAVAELSGQPLAAVPNTTAMGALVTHITGGAEAKTFQPMNVNFGLFPPLDGVKSGRRGRKERYKAYTDRAKIDWQAWLGQTVLDTAAE